MNFGISESFKFTILDSIPSNFEEEIQLSKGKAYLLDESFFQSFSNDLLRDLNEDQSLLLCEAYSGLCDLFNYLEDQILFPGTFNPFHDGHKECIRQVKELRPESRIVIIPDRNPHKENMIKNPFKRARDIYLEFEGDKGIEIYPGFLASPNPNPTVDWIGKINGQRTLLMGADSFENLNSWKDYKELLKSLDEIIVIPRQSDSTIFNEYSANYQKINPELRTLRLNPHPFENISSSQLKLKNKQF